MGQSMTLGHRPQVLLCRPLPPSIHWRRVVVACLRRHEVECLQEVQYVLRLHLMQDSVDDGRPSSRGAGISWVATRADPRSLREAVFTESLPGAKIVGTPRAIRITTRDGDVLPAFHWIALGS